MRLFVPITRGEFEALAALARKERRRPQDQAAALIAQGLVEGGVLARPAFEAATHPAPTGEQNDHEPA